MKSKLNILIAFALITCGILESCKKVEIKPQVLGNKEISNSNLKDSIYKGAPVKLFGGKAWVWVKLNSSGMPKQLAITLTNKVFQTVPFDSSEEEHEIVVPAPPQATITAFYDFAIDWSPQGHLPQGIYDVPLFDLHFYKITETERQAIISDPQYVEHYQNYPGHKYLPKNYDTVYEGGIPGGGCLTGRHRYDITSAEFHGQDFTQTFVYGTYNGKVDFYDPMITLDFLKNTQGFQRTIPQPSKFTPNGYYPTKMEVVKHASSTDVILEGFKLRAAQ